MYYWLYMYLELLHVHIYISTLDYNDILKKPEETVGFVVWLCRYLAKMGGVQNLLCSVLTGLLTWGMVRLIGKPKL